MSAGTLNYKHKTLSDRQNYANKFIKEYNFNDITTYLDTMTDNLQFELSAWPFRYYIIKYDCLVNKYKFKFIPNPSDSEFDLTEIFNHV
jgi:hypothetical protein